MGSPKIVRIDASVEAGDRKYRCLDVFDRVQGERMLWTCHTLFILFVLVGLTLVWMEMLCINVENADFRDIIDDYRLTFPGVQAHHRKGFIERRPAVFVCDWGEPACRGEAPGQSAGLTVGTPSEWDCAGVVAARVGPLANMACNAVIATIDWSATTDTPLSWCHDEPGCSATHFLPPGVQSRKHQIFSEAGGMHDPRLLPFYEGLRMDLLKVDNTEYGAFSGRQFTYKMAMLGAAADATIAVAVAQESVACTPPGWNEFKRSGADCTTSTGANSTASYQPSTGLVGGCSADGESCSPVLLRLFDNSLVQTGAEPIQREMRYLTEVVIEVGFYDGHYWVDGAEGYYSTEPDWVGPADSSPTFGPTDNAELNFIVRDVSQPRPELPGFTGGWRMLMGMTFFPAVIFLWVLGRALVQYWIMSRSLFNRKQHPPFFASMRRYRGW